MKQLFIYLFICLTAIMYGQDVVKGFVIHKKSHEPISYASVYINGSNKGTRTDAKGFFSLSGVKPPCLIVFSHLNYELKTVYIENFSSDTLSIALTEKKIELSEITITGKSLRRESVEEFRKAFLGIDSWGNKATLLNDSVLVFSRKTETGYAGADASNPFETTLIGDSALSSATTDSIRKLDNLFSASSSAFSKTLIPSNTRFNKPFKLNTTNSDQPASPEIKTIETFTTSTKAPLMVDMPLLGYTMYVDLVSFSVCQIKGGASSSSLLGYFYFKPYEIDNKRKQAKIEKNRRSVYYNSALHFNRALYNNSFKSNGYVVIYQSKADSVKNRKFSFINMDSTLLYTDKDEAYMSGLKGKNFQVYYLASEDGSPLNLANTSLYNFESVQAFMKDHFSKINFQDSSILYFLGDNCLIRNNGTTPDNKVAFGGAISRKKAATLLPDDYEPE